MMTLFLSLSLLWWLISAVFANFQNSASYNGYQYSLYAGTNDEVEFCPASFRCSRKKIGGVLAMPKTESINDVVYEVLRTSSYNEAWIGGFDMLSEGYWQWIDETSMDETNWQPGEPNGLEKDIPDEDCLGISDQEGFSGTWFDSSCLRKRGYICQFPLNLARAFDDSDFTFYEGKSNFKGAQEKCEKIGARIVKVETDEEAEILRRKLTNIARDFPYWIKKKSVDDSLCQIVGVSNIEQRECEEMSYGTLCENVRPKTEVSNEQPEVKEGQALQVDCTATGYPSPRVSWYKDDKLVSSQSMGDSSSSLLIQKASSGDAGRYICAATNEINGKPVVAKGFSYVSVHSKDD